LGRGGPQCYRINDRDLVGLAYAVMFDNWSHGLATEMAEANQTVSFVRLGLPEVTCCTLPNNHASHRVMEKVGFRYQEELVCASVPFRVYRLSAAAWNWRMGCLGDCLP